MDLDAFKVTRVFTIKANGLGLLGVAHPLMHTMTVFCQQVGHGGAKASASQDRNSVLFSHMQSRFPSSSGNTGIIRSTSPLAYRELCLKKCKTSVNMPLWFSHSRGSFAALQNERQQVKDDN
uniref:Uncharacterized protein n=1 Tax=uncultured Pseudomonadales bacterium HF0500_12O04 TaxID=710779 RepID=E0XYC5_9GAMM|nr:hypothetical protein [uncultured Pseudomonadales bacterium HF0500_12O04]